MIADGLLREADTITLAELHPQEKAALQHALPTAHVHQTDGYALAHAKLPPTPCRGILLIDPSYEVKTDYDDIPRHIRNYARAWNVGIIALWYPILTSNAHTNILTTLEKDHMDALRHEVSFPPARPGHGMVGSGLFVLRPPFGLAERAAKLNTWFDQLK